MKSRNLLLSCFPYLMFGQRMEHNRRNKMPILANLSRRFHMLTTDAIPEPPRIESKEYTHNLNADKTKEKSNAKSETDNTQTNGSVPTSNSPGTEKDEAKFPTYDSKQRYKTNAKTKTKPKQYSQTARTVNYNIINSNGVKIGSRTSYICHVNQVPTKDTATSEDFGSKSWKQEMPENVKCLCQCTDEITLEDILVVKTHIGHGWRDVARKLSYSDGQIEQFEENYSFKGISEVIYQMFLDWKQANTKTAEIGNLTNALWACQEYDCAKRLATSRKDLI
ncbi:death domain-containing immune deficiency protein isoform X1 [Megalopta genalis]|uniref:death domain-containing immune deficiency protein isoform X1 n=2 Tax=Megalopta genalis TaxID=115081 RepID=UPI003FD1A37E